MYGSTDVKCPEKGYLYLCAGLRHSVVSDSLQSHGLQPASLLCPWDSPGKNTGVGIHSLLQGIFPAQGSNLGLLHCRQILNHLSHQGSNSLSIYIQIDRQTDRYFFKVSYMIIAHYHLFPMNFFSPFPEIVIFMRSIIGGTLKNDKRMVNIYLT